MKKILIIDDDAWLADNYRLLLEAHGWQVTITASANEAINLIDELEPSILLLDYLLPLQSAPALLHELQSYSDTQKIPVVLCTSLELAAGISLKEYGVLRLLDKTKVTPAQIIEVIEEIYYATIKD